MDKERAYIGKEPDVDNKIEKNDDEHIIIVLYRLGLYMLIPVVLLIAFAGTDSARQLLLNSGYSCYFMNATGVPCPGCGGTRAFIRFGEFKFIESIKMNAAVFTGILIYAVFMVTETIHFKYHKSGFNEKHVNIGICFFIAVILIQWVIKIVCI